ncbi:MAG TPA: ABC transporter substrate-binding protein, partial [Bacteroidia bacterium]|nr:ABC transporter substrate-binding protein [Bacteroidia bacterium]
MKRSSLAGLAALHLLAMLILGCNPEPKTTDPNANAQDTVPVMGDWIRIYHAADPDGLHPYTTRNAYATFIKENIHMYLFDYDAQTMEHVPSLAVGKPEISTDGLNYTYEIRPEAKWDNGDPITGYDYEFSMKCVKNPLTDNAQQRNYHSFIKDVLVDSTNTRRFTVVTDAPFFLAETAISGVEVVSKAHFDPNKVLDKYRVLDFYSKEKEIANDPANIQFSEEFNGEANQRDPARIYGCGPYKLESWTPGDNVTLVRKKDWWGDQLRGKSWYFQAYAQKLIFKTIKDRSTLPAAAKNDELDVVRDMTPDDFKALREDTAGRVFKNYNFHTPPSYSTVYLGFNCRPPAGRNPVVEDVAVRKALAHLTDIDGIIENVYLGF